MNKAIAKKFTRSSAKFLPGKIMTYGQIADILGEGYTARTVGYVMHAADTENIPWQRVINSQGECSTDKLLLPHNIQQKMLEDEGVIFNEKGKCDLEKLSLVSRRFRADRRRTAEFIRLKEIINRDRQDRQDIRKFIL